MSKKGGPNPYERAIMNVLRNARRPLSTSEVAQYTGMSWTTADKYLSRLYNKRKSLHTRKKGHARLWFVK